MLTLLEYPHKDLKKVAQPITEFDDGLIILAQNLFDAMYQYHHWGLAAPEVGIPSRVIVTAGVLSDKPICMVNPEIIAHQGEILCEEDSLTFPGAYIPVKRNKQITLQYQDLDNNLQVLQLEDVISGMVQQKIDYLNGILLIDHLSKLKRDRFLSKYKKVQACGHGCGHEHH